MDIACNLSEMCSPIWTRRWFPSGGSGLVNQESSLTHGKKKIKSCLQSQVCCLIILVWVYSAVIWFSFCFMLSLGIKRSYANVWHQGVIVKQFEISPQIGIWKESCDTVSACHHPLPAGNVFCPWEIHLPKFWKHRTLLLAEVIIQIGVFLTLDDNRGSVMPQRVIFVHRGWVLWQWEQPIKNHHSPSKMNQFGLKSTALLIFPELFSIHGFEIFLYQW